MTLASFVVGMERLYQGKTLVSRDDIKKRKRNRERKTMGMAIEAKEGQQRARKDGRN